MSVWQVSSVKVFTGVVPAMLCPDRSRGVTSQCRGQGVSAPSPREGLLIGLLLRHLEFLPFFNTLALMLLNSSLALPEH